MNKVTINVTQEMIDQSIADIDKGGLVSGRCPVARAMNKAVLPGMYARVGITVASVILGQPGDADHEHICDVDLPRVATDFIHAFDWRRSSESVPAPITFTLDMEAQ